MLTETAYLRNIFALAFIAKCSCDYRYRGNSYRYAIRGTDKCI